MQKIHYILGYLGLIPFIGLTWLTIIQWPDALRLLISYSALIISFLAGTLWAATTTKHTDKMTALISNLFMLMSWIALSMNNAFVSLITCGLLLLTILLYEYINLKQLLPKEMMTMRIRLTAVASISLFVAAFFK